MIEYTGEASVLCRERITKALTRLRVCESWSASLLFACDKIGLSRGETHITALNPAPLSHIPVGLNFLLPNFESKI